MLPQKAGRNALCVSWSPDGGRLLVLQRGADSCEVWEATGGRLAVLHATVAEFEDARFVGVDGRFVLTTSVLRVQSVMWDVDGGTSAALPPCKHAPGSLACSEDGSLIVYASRPATADELVVVALAQPKAGAGGAEGTSEATWRVLAALPLPTRDACKVWLCRSDTAALVLDDALADKALVMPLLSGATPLAVDLRAGSAAGSAAGFAAGKGASKRGGAPGARVAGLFGRCAVAQAGSGALVAVGCHDGRVVFASQDTGARVGSYRAPDRVSADDVAVFVEEQGEGKDKPSPAPAASLAAGAGAGAHGSAGERAAARLGRKAAVPTQRRTAMTAMEAAAPSSLVVVPSGAVELPGEAPRATAGPGCRGRDAGAGRRPSGAGAAAPAQAHLSGGVSRLSFSASGRFVAWRDDACRRVALIGRAGGGQLIAALVAAAPVAAMHWRPRRAGLPDALAVVTSQGKTVVLTPGEGRAFLLDVGEGFAVRAASWSPDGSKLLVHNGHEWQLGCLLAAQGGDGE